MLSRQRMPLIKDKHLARIFSFLIVFSTLSLAATWFARSWLQFTGEFIVVDSTRPQRMIANDPAHVTERQFQLLARLYY